MHKPMRGQKRAIVKRTKAQCVNGDPTPVEQAADNLPERFRTVFMLRVVEDMSVEETANLLGLQP
jgi:DNA-directed RNA polymerase specialized sigma24 family protein